MAKVSFLLLPPEEYSVPYKVVQLNILYILKGHRKCDHLSVPLLKVQWRISRTESALPL